MDHEIDAEKFCKYYLGLPHVQAYAHMVRQSEGELSGMIVSCLGYIWEKENPKDGIAAYYSYLSATYDNYYNDPNHTVRFTEQQVDHEQNYGFDISSDSGAWSTLGYTPFGEGEPDVGTLVGSPSGVLLEAHALQDEGYPEYVSKWIEYWAYTLTQKDRDIVWAWVNDPSSYQTIGEYVDATSEEVEKVIRKVKMRGRLLAASSAA